jgi:c(7)-type cytochrome triheme protein
MTSPEEATMRKALFVVLVLFVGAGIAWASGTKKRKLPPYEFGSVTINNYSQQSGMPPVVFDHWVHRQHFTCRLCHVDIGFGMTAGATKVRAADNMKGYYCGTCHNGRLKVNNKKVFEACAKEFSREEYNRCVKCHALERDTTKEEEFFRFADNLPKERFGNGINWEKAEEEGLIKPLDQLEGVSIMKAKLGIQKDFSLKAKVEGMPDIIFSHKKHTVWNGCELCHPEIFIGIKKGTTKYSMVELFDGKYCGACHDKVAFPQTDCQRCHTKPV